MNFAVLDVHYQLKHFCKSCVILH